METAKIINQTNGSLPDDSVLPYPIQHFPAWVPALMVAVSMIIFLAGSFYFRHRKVIKKRQILMDYFYIIFQYGGMRRKRMVAALCNTNAITLRELGRSFMRSFDSLANPDNSCPFFLEDPSWSPPHVQQQTPSIQKKSFFRNRGMTLTKKQRGPFIRINSQPEDNGQSNTVPFHDIMMKFKGRRHGNAPTALTPSPTNRRNSHSRQYEGSSMCTIHGDDFNYQKYIEENEIAENYHRQRRNAYVIQSDQKSPSFSDVNTDVGRYSLGHALPERFKVQQASISGKRNSEPFQSIQGQDSFPVPDQQPCKFHVHGDLLSPSSVVCGSHGFIGKTHEQGHCQQYRNSEPTILIHSPGPEAGTSQGWSDIRSRYTNGVVFLKRFPKVDGAPGEFYYEEQMAPSPDPARRASLSKVSYVPSGNMNEYYNCFNSSIKEKQSKEDAVKGKRLTPLNSPRPFGIRSKKSRLSLGDLAISNFNRRIDLGSDSLHEQESEHQTDSKGSHDSARSTPKTAWTKFKNVFTGSRAAQATNAQVKSLKSLPAKQERYKRRGQRRSTSWQKFVSVFTGFRSLPESKKYSTSLDIPRGSKSFPSGLDVHISNCDGSFCIETDTENISTEMFQPRLYDPSEQAKSYVAGLKIYENSTSNQDKNATLRSFERPTTLHLPLKTQSFPEELIHGRQPYQRFKTVLDATRAIQNKVNQPGRSGVRRYRKRNDRVVASSLSLPQSKKDFSCYAFQAAYSPSNHEYRFRSYSDSNDDRSEPETPTGAEVEDSPSQSRCFRKLSPLPERHQAAQENDTAGLTKHEDEMDTLSYKSLDMTPIEKGDISFQQEMETSVNSPGGLLIRKEAAHHRDTPEYGYTHGRTSSIKNKSSMLMMQENGNVHKLKKSINSKPYFSLGERLPQESHITNEHKLIGRSVDSVYYDTVSALESPSPSLCRNGLNPWESPRQFSWEFALRSGPETPLDLSEKSMKTRALSLTNVKSDLLEDTTNQTFLKESRFLKQAPPESNVNKSEHKEANATHPLHSAQSMPSLSIEKLMTQYIPPKGLLSKNFCSSQPRKSFPDPKLKIHKSHDLILSSNQPQRNKQNINKHDPKNFDLLKETKSSSVPVHIQHRKSSLQRVCDIPEEDCNSYSTRMPGMSCRISQSVEFPVCTTQDQGSTDDTSGSLTSTSLGQTFTTTATSATKTRTAEVANTAAALTTTAVLTARPRTSKEVSFINISSSDTL